ncbi:carboxymuconolactone decarboxylase family protein [Isoptericola sp. BMS4]|uniref:carboxymuconolactone decarboxylase family protein n=1 Tax=Isoptericola sp. BMS4 TaxID=2527875 RepID=UPI0014222B14|nr:carboxymuconolactone decarboxylase family protein [Isoptericola sp. BMS4]
MTARMKSPATYLPEVLSPMQALGQAPRGHGVPDETLELVHQRVSQINGCAWCLDFGARAARKAGMDVDKLAVLAGWPESPRFDDAERAALALAESVTRIADRSDRVPDDVWDEAVRHYDEEALAALVLHISMVNVYNRLNVTVRQVPGTFS